MVSEDPEPIVRTFLVGKFANIFQQCQKHASPDLEYYLNDLLLDIIVKYLYEGTKEIRREAFVNLMKIIEHLETNKKKIEDKVLPAIVELSQNSDYELNLMAIRFMARMACILGPEKTKELILDRFIEFCTFPMDPFRRTCACVFPSICYAMGVEFTDAKLIDRFLTLCKDSFWGVRKACAESITSIALLCSPECKKERLAPMVLSLAKDDSKWVVCATLKKLGQFISTFAKPCVTGLVFSEAGELLITNPTDEDFRDHANAELLANYQYYLDRFSEEETQRTTNNCQRRCYENALSCEQIAQRIVETKTKLFEQVNYDTYLKKRMFSCLDVDSSLELNKNISDNTIISSESQDLSDINKDFSLLIDVFTATPKAEVDRDECFSSSTENEKDISNVVPESSCSSGETVKRTTTGELHTKNRRITGPSDLSSIIKKAIDETQEKNKMKTHPPPLMRQASREDISSNSGKTSAKIKSADVFQTTSSLAEDAEVAKQVLREWDLFSEVEIDLNNLPDVVEQVSMGSSDKSKKRRRSDMHHPYYHSTSERDSFSSDNGHLNEREIDKSCERATSDFDSDSKLNDSNSEDEAFMEYNSHKYWYISPDMPLDPDLVKVESSNKLDDYGTLFGKVISYKLPSDYQQNIVPPGILKAFVNMVLYDEDEGINLSCAYNFPAVALTIGKSNWHLLKSLLQYLCDDLDWKVRKTIASYIDLLAMILGREIASNDLLPIYVGFFKDLDEVKIKAIKNAANFLKVIDHQKHEDVLSRIGDCLRVDSKTNWRIKEDLAKQVLLLIKMYNFVNKQDSFLYVTSLTALFLEDKISCVREIAADAMVEIIRIANTNEREGIVKLFLVKEFAMSDSWRKRQTFLNTLLKLIKCDQPPTDVFRLVFPSVRNLSYDSIPNVRLLVAKCLDELTKLDESVFKLKDFEDVASIVAIIRRLSCDEDRDVRDILSSIEESKLLELYNPGTYEEDEPQNEQNNSVPEEKEAPVSNTEEIEIKLRDAIISESQT